MFGYHFAYLRALLPSVGLFGRFRVRVDGLQAGRISGERLVIPKQRTIKKHKHIRVQGEGEQIRQSFRPMFGRSVS